MAAAAKPKKPKPLTDKQKAFITEYLKDKNGAAAAERAGYAPKDSKQQAYKLLHDDRIRVAIDQVLDVNAMRASEAFRCSRTGRGAASGSFCRSTRMAGRSST